MVKIIVEVKIHYMCVCVCVPGVFWLEHRTYHPFLRQHIGTTAVYFIFGAIFNLTSVHMYSIHTAGKAYTCT